MIQRAEFNGNIVISDTSDNNSELQSSHNSCSLLLYDGPTSAMSRREAACNTAVSWQTGNTDKNSDFLPSSSAKNKSGIAVPQKTQSLL